MGQISLRELQILLSENIRSEGLSPQVRDLLQDAPPVSKETRMDIYQYGYQSRMLENLSVDFERVQAQTGEAEFSKLVSEYCKQHPSQSFNISEISAQFPEFLKLKDKNLYDLALQDWLEIKSLYANPLASERLLSITELQNTNNAYIAVNSSTFYQKGIGKIFVSYRNFSGYNSVQISETEFQLLKNLQTPVTFERLSEIMIALGYNEDSMFTLIQSWISLEILVCLKTEH